MYIDKKPFSILQFADKWDNIIAIHSLSKRSNATGLRVGFVAGGENIIKNYRNLRTQIDSGVANAVQEGAIAAWKDEKHVEEMRQMYNKRRSVIVSALNKADMKVWAEATFYIWVKINGSSIDFAKKMIQLDEKRKIGINITPGKVLALNNTKIADSYVRFALVPSLEDTKLAAQLISEHYRG